MRVGGLRTDGPQPLLAQATIERQVRLARVVAKLLTNATSYTQDAGKIRLSVVVTRTRWASTAADLSSSGLLRIALTRRVAVLGDRLDEGSRSGIDVAAVGQQDAGILVTRGQLGRNAGPVEQGLG